MSENTKIEWADATINPWWGCTKVSPGCANCYADTFAKRLGKNLWGGGVPRENHLAGARKTAMKLNQQAYRLGMRPRVFCASMADWLDDEVPIEWLADLLDIIRRTPNLDWLLLTKRPQNFKTRLDLLLSEMGSRMSLDWSCTKAFIENMRLGWSGVTYSAPEVGRENYWIGTTVEDQQRADERIPQLLQIPARVRFLSCEPLLGPVRIQTYREDDGYAFVDFPLSGRRSHKQGGWFDQAMPRIHWVICGGESGPKTRPMDVEWAQSLRDQCDAAGVPFFMKQIGGTRKPFPPIPDDLMIRQFPA